MGRIFDTLYALWSDETSEYLISSIFSGSKHKQEKNKLFCGYIYIFIYLSWNSHCFVCYVRYLKRLYAQETCHWWQEESLEKEAQVYPFSSVLVYIFVCIICMNVFIFKAIDIFYGYPFGYLFGCWEIWENASQWKCGIITDENVLLMYWA